MAIVSIENDQLVVRMHGWQAIFAIRREVRVALNHIISVEAGTLTSLQPDGIRLGGSYVPGLITAGQYWSRKHGWSFWSVRRRQRAIDIRAHDEHFKRIVVEVADPHATAGLIESTAASLQ